MIQPCVSNPVIIHLELVHAPHIWDLEHGLIYSVGLFLQSGADEGINAHELELNVGSVERLPFAVLQLFNLDSVHLYNKYGFAV